MADERAARVAELHAWQRHYNMEPRGDSRLTELYADGHLGAMRVDEVARELVVTDLLYKRPLSGEVIEDFMRHVAARLRRDYPGLSWTRTWEIVRIYAPIALKLLCVRSAA